MTMETELPGWLLVIDLQHAFIHPSSPWCTELPDAYEERLGRLASKYRDRTLFTRFEPQVIPGGSWQAYYKKWTFAVDPDNAWMWALPDHWCMFPSITRHTFSKADVELSSHVEGTRNITLVGLSTECCVLATAFSAVDLGYRVTVVSDMCISRSPELHAQALAMMALRSPQLVIRSFAEEISSNGY